MRLNEKALVGAVVAVVEMGAVFYVSLLSELYHMYVTFTFPMVVGSYCV